MIRRELQLVSVICPLRWCWSMESVISDLYLMGPTTQLQSVILKWPDANVSNYIHNYWPTSNISDAAWWWKIVRQQKHIVGAKKPKKFLSYFENSNLFQIWPTCLNLSKFIKLLYLFQALNCLLILFK